MKIIKSTKTETLYESFDGNIFDTEHKCKLYEARNVYETYVQKIEFLDITYDTFKCNDADDWYYIIYYLRFNLGSGFNVYEKDFLKYAGEQLIVEYDSGEDWDICRLRCANDFVKDLEETLNKTKTNIDKIKFLAQLPPLVLNMVTITRINAVDIYKTIKDELATYPDIWDEKCWELACKIHAKYENERVTPKYNSTTDGVKRYECAVCGKEVTGCNYCPNCGVRLN